MFFMAIENKQDALKVERLYEQYSKLMFWSANKILKDSRLAEDAVHESFIRIINNLHKIDENNCPRTRNFLVIICRNVAINLYHSKSPLNFEEDIVEKVGCSEYLDPENIVLNRETLEHAANIIQGLDMKYRDVFLLRRVYGFSREEIAQMFGIQIETVKKRLTRAKAMIVKALEKEEAQ